MANDSKADSGRTAPAREGIRLGSVVLDAPDPLGLAAFYAELLGWKVDAADASEDWVTIRGAEAGSLAFQRAPELTQVTWPDGPVPQQFHLDLHVDDYEGPEARALALGATVLDAGDDHPGYRVYADPAGHPFCLCRQPADS